MNFDDLEHLAEFDAHELVSFMYDAKSGLKGFIAIHRDGMPTPALGATRLWSYESETEALRDALRLSRMMSYKSALAGLKYGGAKGVIIAPPGGIRDRKALFHAYAQRLNYFGGRFITGTDVGLTDDDILFMRKETSYVIGTRVNPAFYTAVGVCHGIRSAVERVFGSGKLSGRSFAVQGVGKTGIRIVESLYRETAKIAIADLDASRVQEVKRRFPKVKVVSPAHIHREPVDVFVPCALGGVLNPQSVAELRVKIVAGSANNQLEGNHIGPLLHQLGILYAPDYVINAGGLISVVDEFEYEKPDEKRILRRIDRISKTLHTIFEKSKRQNKPTNIVANEMAERIFNKQ